MRMQPFSPASMRYLGVICLSVTLFYNPAHAQGTYTAVSCNRSDVNAVINGPTHTAVNGDTIIIPAGTCTWTSGITVSGVGIDITGTGTPNTGGGTVGAGTANTTLNQTSSSAFFAFTGLTQGQTAKVELLNMGTSDTGTNAVGAVTFSGTCNSSGCPNIRVDNINFTANQWEAALLGGFVTTDDVFGVIDHNTATESVNASPPLTDINFDAWQGVGHYGDNSFAAADTFGTAQALYIENNLLSGVRGSEDVVSSDSGQGGSRYVCRFNTVTQISGTGLCSAHGTGWIGRERGQRQVEVYYNTADCSWSLVSCNALDGLNSGTGYYFSNTINTTGGGLNSMTVLDVPRLGSGSAFGECQSGSLYDQAPFSTTSQCFDQTGTGAGLLMENATPVLVSNPSCTSGSAGACWAQNALDPVYEAGEVCNRTDGGGCSPAFVATSSEASSRVTANKYFYAEVSMSAQSSPTSPFNGTSGTGYGTLANRPTTCTPHVGYWATDQGNWNTYSSTQVGELFVCTATNTWTMSYQPYTYPHPLVSGGTSGTGGDPPTAPTGLTATVE